jgi:sporulation protein YlmC with PRC-barrel domain
MREGSAAEIRNGMKVMDRDGNPLGSVTEVLMDEASGIFHGLAVRPNLFTHDLEVSADHVDALRDEVVYTDVIQEELEPYYTASERYHEVSEAYSESGV